jgi:hypothetical protein
MTRLIQNTDHEMQYAWPVWMLVQGGKSGLVITPEGEPNYTTAFVEAFPKGTFLRGEGETLAQAEKVCWLKVLEMASCPAAPQHGPFERRHFRNGCGFCTKCGTWFNAEVTGFDELPDDPERLPSQLEKLLMAFAEDEE